MDDAEFLDYFQGKINTIVADAARVTLLTLGEVDRFLLLTNNLVQGGDNDMNRAWARCVMDSLNQGSDDILYK